MAPMVCSFEEMPHSKRFSEHGNKSYVPIFVNGKKSDYDI